jgi:hypothetical protein
MRFSAFGNKTWTFATESGTSHTGRLQFTSLYRKTLNKLARDAPAYLSLSVKVKRFCNIDVNILFSKNQNYSI